MKVFFPLLSVGGCTPHNTVYKLHSNYYGKISPVILPTPPPPHIHTHSHIHAYNTQRGETSSHPRGLHHVQCLANLNPDTKCHRPYRHKHTHGQNQSAILIRYDQWMISRSLPLEVDECTPNGAASAKLSFQPCCVKRGGRRLHAVFISRNTRKSPCNGKSKR